MPGKKSGNFNKKGTEGIANDKPAVYKIKNDRGKTIYAGSAKRGRVEDRLKEHLPGGSDPVRGGSKFNIQQKSSIAGAQKTEKIIIKREKPSQNKQGK